MVGTTVDTCEVDLWGRTIGAAYWDSDRGLAAFEYDPAFQRSGIELAPQMMPLGRRIFRFPELQRSSFHGLPGLLADSLPDDFGNAVIDQWLIREGRDRNGFSPIEQLCYVGRRGMGALEYRPSIRNTTRGSILVDAGTLTKLAQHILDLREGLKIRITASEKDYSRSLDDILRVGTSAGGARAKAVVAWNPDTNEMRSGQAAAPPGFGHWLLKLDGVSNRDRDRGLTDPQGNGRIEYAYALMAEAAGIEMSECQLLPENGRSHFMTRRFDRTLNGDKLHMQSLYAMMHLDNQMAGAHSYEQAFDAMYQLRLPATSFSELFRRMVFNVVARNQHDHSKNISFLMNKTGDWSLAPAFDVIYAYNPDGEWTSRHQMTINGARSGFQRSDLLAVARRFRVRNAQAVIDQVRAAVREWRGFAEQAGVPDRVADEIAVTHRSLQH